MGGETTLAGLFAGGLFLMLLTGQAFGGTPLEPPARYDHPYDGPVEIRKIDRANVWKECSRNGAVKMRRDVAGCARVEDGVCIIHLAMKTRRAPLDAILRHEIAHCNGWPGNHPD